jgi:hypothetical protein
VRQVVRAAVRHRWSGLAVLQSIAQCRRTAGTLFPVAVDGAGGTFLQSIADGTPYRHENIRNASSGSLMTA